MLRDSYRIYRIFRQGSVEDFSSGRRYGVCTAVGARPIVGETYRNPPHAGRSHSKVECSYPPTPPNMVICGKRKKDRVQFLGNFNFFKVA